MVELYRKVQKTVAISRNMTVMNQSWGEEKFHRRELYDFDIEKLLCPFSAAERFLWGQIRKDADPHRISEIYYSMGESRVHAKSLLSR